jgi:hypothetical protein
VAAAGCSSKQNTRDASTDVAVSPDVAEALDTRDAGDSTSAPDAGDSAEAPDTPFDFGSVAEVSDADDAADAGDASVEARIP